MGVLAGEQLLELGEHALGFLGAPGLGVRAQLLAGLLDARGAKLRLRSSNDLALHADEILLDVVERLR